MQIGKKFSKLFGWMMKGLAVVAVPLLLPSSVGVGQRAGITGALLVWLYIGRLAKPEEPIED